MAELKIKADSGGGTVSLKGPASTTLDAAVQLTLPVDDGAANQYLKTDGSGALSWATVSSGAALSNDANNRVVTADGSGGINGEANLTFDGSVLRLENTTASGDGVIYLEGGEGGSSIIEMVADEGDDDADKFRIIVGDGGPLKIQNKAGGSYETNIECYGNGAVKLYKDNTLMCETSNDGLKFPDGKGIDFSADGNNAGMESELLDDYEEGQFTLEPNANLTFDSSYNSGSYIKIGKLVHVRGYFSPDSTGGTGTDNVQITLPFSAENAAEHATSGANGIMHRNIDGVGDVVCAWVAGNATKFWLFTCQDNGAWAAINNSNISDATECYFSFTYRAAS